MGGADGRVALEGHFVLGVDHLRGGGERRIGGISRHLWLSPAPRRGAAHVVEQLGGGGERRGRRLLPFDLSCLAALMACSSRSHTTAT